MDIPDDVYGLHAASHANDGISSELGLDYDLFCNTSQPGFLEGNNGGTNAIYAMEQPDQVHVNAGYVNNEGRDVMFCPEQKYDVVGQYTGEPINIPRSTRQEPLTLTPPRSVGSDSPMDEQGLSVHIGPDSTIDVEKFSSLFGNHSLLGNGLEEPMTTSSGCMMAHTVCEPEPRRKRRKTEPDAMISDCPVGMATIKSEPGSLTDDVFIDTDSRSSSVSNDMLTPDADVTSYQCIKWADFKKAQWNDLYDDSQDIISKVDLIVDADKGFNFSFADDSFVCQKKNHFQITVNVNTESTAKYIKVKDTFKPIDKFKIHLFGVKVESINSTIKVEQSQADRSKRPYEPAVMPAPGPEASRMTIGRLHFSETTSNNMRKKGKPNPDQRYFMLAVALHAHTKNENQLIYATVSDRIIVRASNPGQFENDVEVVWSRGHTSDSVFRVGRVGINTDKPCESLSVHGNIRVSGRILVPSDIRIKENLTEVDSREQLRNVSKMKLYRYSYSQEYLDVAGTHIDPDTGVIAQQVQQVLPDAVKESEDLKLLDGKTIEKFLVVNKERIFMENVGAVKELCKLTDNLEIRINELEQVGKKLHSRRRADTASSCFSNLSRASSSSHSSSARSSQNERTPARENKSGCHGHRYRCPKHDCHQQRCHQEVVLDEPSLCTPRFMQFVIVTLVLVMSLSIGAMVTLYIMQDSKQDGYLGDSSEAFQHGVPEANVTTKPKTSSFPSSSISQKTTEIAMATSSHPSPIVILSTSQAITTSSSTKEITPTPTGNSTKNSTSSMAKPDHPVLTEVTPHPTPTTTPIPVCHCCRNVENCNSVPNKLLSNKPIYYEISNALAPASKFSKDVTLRIVEKNYHLNCDICGSTNESFYIPVSSSVPFQPITVEINSTSDTLVLHCSNVYRLQCPEMVSQPSYDTVFTKDTWKKHHTWKLPPAFYFSSKFRFRVVNKSLNPSAPRVNCSSTRSGSAHLFKDYYIHFIRVCKT